MYNKKLFYGTDIPQRHRLFELKDNKDENWLANYNLLKEKFEQKGIIGLYGSRGGGKTQACAVITAMNASNGRKGLYSKASKIFLKIRDAQSTGALMKTFDEFSSPHLLIIDAFQIRANTEFEYRTLVSIIDDRYDAMKPTIIVSNDSPKVFLEALGDDISSRMQEGGAMIFFNSTSFRGAK